MRVIKPKTVKAWADAHPGAKSSLVNCFVAGYESSQHTTLESRPRVPLENLKYLLEENGMTAADLSRLLGTDRTLGAKILRGERNLTVPHLRILSERFRVSPALFI